MADSLDVRERLLAKRIKAYEEKKLKKWEAPDLGYTDTQRILRCTEKRKLCQPSEYCVYALVDIQGVFYIGVTNDVATRWIAHKSNARLGMHAISNRIFNNLRNNSVMHMLPLEWTEDKTREGEWIAYFEEELKIPLMNILLK
jgi:hypothetical protein